MPFFNIIAETNEATVVTEYKPIASNSALYQSEAELEKEFIKLLQNQGYDYINIHKEEDLIVNLRKQLELLNNISFSEEEWDRLFKQKICNQNYGIVEKTRIIQEDYRVVLERDNGTIVNIDLIDKTNVHNNRLQVINQYSVETESRKNRYDVTVLVNGFP